MSLRKMFGTDSAKETDGVPVTFDPNSDGSVPTFVISRMSKSNKRYQKTLEAAARPHQRAMRLETLPESVAEAMLLDVFMSAILVSWSNVYFDEAETELIETNERMREYLLELPELYAELEASAKSIALFREADLEANTGN